MQGSWALKQDPTCCPGFCFLSLPQPPTGLLLGFPLSGALVSRDPQGHRPSTGSRCMGSGAGCHLNSGPSPAGPGSLGPLWGLPQSQVHDGNGHTHMWAESLECEEGGEGLMPSTGQQTRVNVRRPMPQHKSHSRKGTECQPHTPHTRILIQASSLTEPLPCEWQPTWHLPRLHLHSEPRGMRGLWAPATPNCGT